MTMTSCGCSTTQISSWLRPGSLQIAHCSDSVMEPQEEQKWTFCLSSARSAERRSASWSERRRCSARRSALLVPMPGRRESDLTREERVSEPKSIACGAGSYPVSYTHLRAHETGRNLVC